MRSARRLTPASMSRAMTKSAGTIVRPTPSLNHQGEVTQRDRKWNRVRPPGLVADKRLDVVLGEGDVRDTYRVTVASIASRSRTA